jgi:ankyrin repeat protein
MEKEASMSAPNKMHEGNKAAAAAPAITTAEDVELANVHQPEAKAPLHEDIMQLSRIGEVVPIQKLIESGGVSVTYQDEEGITPLHVCATESRYEIGVYLLIHILVGSYQQSLRSMQIPDRFWSRC